MPTVKTDAEGFAIDTDGKRIQINGEDVKVEGIKTQNDIDDAVKTRLEREKGKITNLENEVKTLREQSNRTEEAEKLLKSKETELSKLQTQLAEAETKARNDVATQMKTLEDDNKSLKEMLAKEQQGRIHDRLSTDILAASGNRFNNPKSDLVPRLIASHKREPATEDGKPVEGKFVDLFEVEVIGDNKERVKKHLPLDKAIEAIHGTFSADPATAHYVRSDARGGSGGGSFKTTQTKGGEDGGINYPSMKK